jgi:hypothetical protein
MIKDIDEAILKAKENCPDEYALQYLNSINKAVEYGKQIGRVKDAFEVQLLYAYSNMEEWTGEVANEVKGFLKEFLKDRLGDAYYEDEEEIGDKEND